MKVIILYRVAGSSYQKIDYPFSSDFAGSLNVSDRIKLGGVCYKITDKSIDFDTGVYYFYATKVKSLDKDY